MINNDSMFAQHALCLHLIEKGGAASKALLIVHLEPLFAFFVVRIFDDQLFLRVIGAEQLDFSGSIARLHLVDVIDVHIVHAKDVFELGEIFLHQQSGSMFRLNVMLSQHTQTAIVRLRPEMVSSSRCTVTKPLVGQLSNDQKNGNIRISIAKSTNLPTFSRSNLERQPRRWANDKCCPNKRKAHHVSAYLRSKRMKTINFRRPNECQQGSCYRNVLTLIAKQTTVDLRLIFIVYMPSLRVYVTFRAIWWCLAI